MSEWSGAKARVDGYLDEAWTRARMAAGPGISIRLVETDDICEASAVPPAQPQVPLAVVRGLTPEDTMLALALMLEDLRKGE